MPTGTDDSVYPVAVVWAVGDTPHFLYNVSATEVGRLASNKAASSLKRTLVLTPVQYYVPETTVRSITAEEFARSVSKQ